MKPWISYRLVGAGMIAGTLLFHAALAATIPAGGVRAPALYDFGDAPDPPYPTLLARNGARHADISEAWFGKTVDAEVDARVPDRDAGDDGLVATNPVTFTVATAPSSGFSRFFDFFRSRTLYVNVLIDHDNNGAWEPATDWVVQNQRVRVAYGRTAQFVAIGVDGKKVSWDREHEGWLRMTLTDVPLSNYNGTTITPFAIGETEDYGPTSNGGKTGEPELGVWCFVKEHACRIVAPGDAAAAKAKGVALKGPYKNILACLPNCKERTIITPTPRRKAPPKQPPAERTIPTKSPATNPPATPPPPSTEMHNLDIAPPAVQLPTGLTAPAKSSATIGCPRFVYTNSCQVAGRATGPKYDCAGSCRPAHNYNNYCDVIDSCASGPDPDFGTYITDPNNILTPEEKASLGVR